MESIYQIRIGGQVIGRMSFQEIQAALSDGSIGAFHQASMDGEHWCSVQDVAQPTPMAPGAYATNTPVERQPDPVAPATPAPTLVQPEFVSPSATPAPAPVGPSHQAGPSHPAAGGAGAAPAELTYHVSVKSERFGPFSEEQLHELVSASRLGPRDLIWREGFIDWVPAEIHLPHLFPKAMSRKRNPVPPEERSVSILAVVSLVSSLTWVGCVVGIILAILGMIDIAGSNGYRKGMVFAVLGLLLGLIGTAAGVGVLLFFQPV